MSNLFEPIQVGNNKLQHRMVMAPLTRFRAGDDHIPLPFVKEYYTQRASVPGTLLISEGTFIAEAAGGYPNVPGIYNDAQIKAWKEITDAVHAKGSFIWCQLWALGRAGNAAYMNSLGHKIVSSSAVAIEPEAAVKEAPGETTVPPTPEPLTEEGIQQFIGYYAQAAKNAIAAGFDGVEIHGANGYLVDQFTQDTCNKRTDRWGGSVENRARFGLEVAKAVSAAIGAEKTGLRLSPYSPWQDMKMKDPVPQFSYLAENLKALKLAYLHVVESRVAGIEDVSGGESIDYLVDIWGQTSPVIVAGGYKADSAKNTLDTKYKGKNVIVAFGRYFIANPDLPYKIKNNLALTPYDRDTFYVPKSEKGYIDYDFCAEFKEAKL